MSAYTIVEYIEHLGPEDAIEYLEAHSRFKLAITVEKYPQFRRWNYVLMSSGNSNLIM